MITRQQVDALNYGDIVRLEIEGKVLEGPVEGQNGYKNVRGRSLRHATSDFRNEWGPRTRIEYIYMFDYKGGTVTIPHEVVDTGYPEYVLANGELTVLCPAGSEYAAAYTNAMRRFDEAIARLA